MEYVPGQNLAQVMSRLTERGGNLAPDIAIWIACEVARGVVKIIDFGVAKLMSATGDTGTGEVRGKLRYMSPEQIRALAIDHRTDIFALGCVSTSS